MKTQQFKGAEPYSWLALYRISEAVPKAGIYASLINPKGAFLVTLRDHHAKIQAIDSLYHHNNRWMSRQVGHSRHQIKVEQIESPAGIDFVIFITYKLDSYKNPTQLFAPEFLVVPIEEIRTRINNKFISRGDRYIFCFHYGEQQIFDQQTLDWEDPQADYTEYREAWHLVSEKLGAKLQPQSRSIAAAPLFRPPH